MKNRGIRILNKLLIPFSSTEPSDQEKQLQELVFGKDIIAATSERQQSAAVKVHMIPAYVAHIMTSTSL